MHCFDLRPLQDAEWFYCPVCGSKTPIILMHGPEDLTVICKGCDRMYAIRGSGEMPPPLEKPLTRIVCEN